jgi:hypothetical protein
MILREDNFLPWRPGQVISSLPAEIGTMSLEIPRILLLVCMYIHLCMYIYKYVDFQKKRRQKLPLSGFTSYEQQ